MTGRSRQHTIDTPLELTGGPFRSIVLLYLSGCLYATTVLTATGSAHLYSYFHLAFIMAVFCLAVASRGFIDGLLRPFTRTWSATFLFAFLAYWLVMGLIHSNAEVGMAYAKYVFNQAVSGILLGYTAFATYGRTKIKKDARGVLRWHPGELRLTLDLIASFAYVWVIKNAFESLLQQARSDIFLISNEGNSQAAYQLFGNYIVLSFISAIYLSEPYVRWRFQRSLIAGGSWALLLAAGCWSSFLLAQLVGSNTGAILALVIGGAVAGVALYRELRSRRRARAVVMLAIFVLLTIWVWQLLGDLPPIRLFNFQPVDAGSTLE